ncbi:MAG: sporulation protein YqfD, partial [Clostridia bacterium]|nr:sporulation protein YqfD [Clostridia bacterium]
VDISGIEEELLRRICELSWVDIKVRGSRVLVEVIERRIPPEQLPGVDLRAGKHAVVTEILVLSGEQRVQLGDEVLPGDVLISGRIIEPSGEERLVRARGIVRGRVAYQGSAEVVLYREEITPTGRLVRGLDVSVPGRGYTLVRPQVPFEHYQMDEQKKKFLVWKDPLWEVTFVTRTYREVIVEPKSYHPLEALREAQQQALEQARSQIVSGGKIVGEHVEVSQVEGKTICR